MPDPEDRLQVRVEREAPAVREVSAAGFIAEILPPESEALEVGEVAMNELRRKFGEKAGRVGRFLGLVDQEGRTPLDVRLGEEREAWEKQILGALVQTNRLSPAELGEVVRAWEAGVEEGELNEEGVTGFVLRLAQERGELARAQGLREEMAGKRERVLKQIAEKEVAEGSRSAEEKVRDVVTSNTLDVLEGASDMVVERFADLQRTAAPTLKDEVIEALTPRFLEKRVFGEVAEERRNQLKGSDFEKNYIAAVQREPEICGAVLTQFAQEKIDELDGKIKRARKDREDNPAEVAVFDRHIGEWERERGEWESYQGEMQAKVESGESFEGQALRDDEREYIWSQISRVGARVGAEGAEMAQQLDSVIAGLEGIQFQGEGDVFAARSQRCRELCADWQYDPVTPQQFRDNVERLTDFIAAEKGGRAAEEGQYARKGQEDLRQELETKYGDLKERVRGESFSWAELNSADLELIRNGDRQGFEMNHGAVSDEEWEEITSICGVDGLVELKGCEERVVLLDKAESLLKREDERMDLEEGEVNGFRPEMMEVLDEIATVFDFDDGYLARQADSSRFTAEKMREENSEMVESLSVFRDRLNLRVAQMAVMSLRGESGYKQAAEATASLSREVRDILQGRVEILEADYSRVLDDREEMVVLQERLRAVDRVIADKEAEVNDLKGLVARHEYQLQSLAEQEGVNGAELMQRAQGYYELDRLEEEAEALSLEERVIERLAAGGRVTAEEGEEIGSLMDGFNQELTLLDLDADREVNEFLDDFFDEMLVSRGFISHDARNRERKALRDSAKRSLRRGKTVWAILAEILMNLSTEREG